MYWKCPTCNNKVDFDNQIMDLFDTKSGEAYFEPLYGIFFHTIFCRNCKSSWIITISEINMRYVKK